LKRLCNVDDDDLSEMLAEIRALNPKPGNAYGEITVQPVIPDVLVRPGPDGAWLVELNSGTLPKVLVNQTYYATVAKGRKSDSDRAYLADCLQTANWLVKSLDQRARTILRVAEEIVRQQDGFLEHGVEHLKPLNLRTVADAISMHESTVSRVTSNKHGDHMASFR
jgi:RNA polymerase sigma-54 factor